MMNTKFFAEATVIEALRPRNSGLAVDTHVLKMRREPLTDYERMRRAVHGPEPVEEDESADETGRKDGK